jgi:hypothetical protein
MITIITGNFFSNKALLRMSMLALLLVPFIAFSQEISKWKRWIL